MEQQFELRTPPTLKSAQVESCSFIHCFDLCSCSSLQGDRFNKRLNSSLIRIFFTGRRGSDQTAFLNELVVIEFPQIAEGKET